MATSIFDIMEVEPDDNMLSEELKETKDYLDRICSFILDEFDDLSKEWKYYGDKSGWILKLINKQRNVLFVIPCVGYFKVSFTFGDKAVNEIMLHELPGFNKQELLNSKRFAEGRTIQLEIKEDRDYNNVLVLIMIKLNN